MWLLLVYKVPPEPAKKRIALWRKLKSMGAVYLQNGVCILPKTDDHTRLLRMVEHDIGEMGGEAILLETSGIDKVQEERMIRRFNDDRNALYKEFLGRCADYQSEIARETAAKNFTYAELEENDVDLKKLRSWLENIKRLDVYDAPLAPSAHEKLHGCEEVLERFSQEVFAVHEEELNHRDAPDLHE